MISAPVHAAAPEPPASDVEFPDAPAFPVADVTAPAPAADELPAALVPTALVAEVDADDPPLAAPAAFCPLDVHPLSTPAATTAPNSDAAPTPVFDLFIMKPRVPFPSQGGHPPPPR
ncbi:hypothetical protein KDK95_18220 [Actinospica sp. MGRD01-02]|uniref:Uncharacterized protein n=1 Tax=Actinospica acidithermotolerans TaxID=2828514 RepID=A0A941EB19_9ACTN|nr:hypothetical protein [Actinospica acidithermotolerans]MBR7828256.1 hypothetical protein [Actinospica acidithermotolerans]